MFRTLLSRRFLAGAAAGVAGGAALTLSNRTRNEPHLLKESDFDHKVTPITVEEIEPRAPTAYDPETGEINWDCPCLGGMAEGPCGEEFKASFSCFVYSKSEPKGAECIPLFQAMQSCFRANPEVYAEHLDESDSSPETESASSSPEHDSRAEPIAISEQEAKRASVSADAKPASTESLADELRKLEDDLQGTVGAAREHARTRVAEIRAQLEKEAETAYSKTSDAVKSAKSSVDQAQKNLSSNVDKATKHVTDQVDSARKTVTSTASDVRDSAADKYTEARNAAESKFQETRAKAAKQVTDKADSARETASSASSSASSTASDVRDSVADKYAEVAKAAEAKYEEARAKAIEQWDNTPNKADAQAAYEKAKADAQAAYDRTKAVAQEKLEAIKDSLDDSVAGVTQFAQSSLNSGAQAADDALNAAQETWGQASSFASEKLDQLSNNGLQESVAAKATEIKKIAVAEIDKVREAADSAESKVKGIFREDSVAYDRIDNIQRKANIVISQIEDNTAAAIEQIEKDPRRLEETIAINGEN